MTMQISQDLRDEAEAFYQFLKTLDEDDWKTPTRFMGWTPWDVVAHLHFFDEVSLASLAGIDAFASCQKRLMGGLATGVSSTQQTRDALGEYEAPALLERWKATCDDMAIQLGDSDPKRRLPWFGPDMGVSMFTTARYMETWAHAQAIYDMKGVERTHTDQIRNVVTIGIKTYGWSFVNRKLEIPGPPPFVRLTAPSGAVWEYNEPSDDAGAEERIEGSALDFCWTVTQVRNVKDTGLVVVGPVATSWMEIAQCFAGAPVDPPAPGVRAGARD